MKRAQIEAENPGERHREAEKRKQEYLRRRHVPGTGLSDSEDEHAGPSHPTVEEDGIPEGPKVMEWSELSESERSRSPLHFVEPGDPPKRARLRPSSESPAPKKGIMRRQLSPETRAKQLEYDAWLKKHTVEEPEEDEGIPVKEQRPASSHGPMPSFIKRSLRSSGPAQASSPVIAPTEENIKKLNALASKRSGKRRSKSPSERSDDSMTANAVAGPSRPRSSAAAADPSSSPSPRGRARTRDGRSSQPKQKSKQKRRRGDSPASDVASVGIDEGIAPGRPSNSRVSRSTWDPYEDIDRPTPNYDDPNFNPARLLGAYIPASERVPDVVSPEEQEEMEDVENLIKVNERRGMWSWLSAFGGAISRQRP